MNNFRLKSKAQIAFAMLASVAIVATTLMTFSCRKILEGKENIESSITITLPPISTDERAIAADEVSDFKNATVLYRVTMNGFVQEGTQTTYSASFPVGTLVKVTIECLDSAYAVLVRAQKFTTVVRGKTEVSIMFDRDGEIVNRPIQKEQPLEADEFFFEFWFGDFYQEQDGDHFAPVKFEGGITEARMRVRSGEDIESAIRTWYAQHGNFTQLHYILDEQTKSSTDNGDASLISNFQVYNGTTFSKTEMNGKTWTVVIE